MSTKIRTNQIDYVINKQRISDKYDIYYLVTSEKYIKRGAYILDAVAFCNDIKAVKFESGKRMLILMKKDVRNKDKLKEFINSIEDGDKYAILQITADEVQDYLLIQLLMNAMGSYDTEFLNYNNLTGHFYCFHSSWLKHGKNRQEDIVLKVPCLELAVTEELCLKVAVRTFTSELLKKKITFRKRKFEEYPKYIFAANQTLRRRLKGEMEAGFILRQTDGDKTEIPFLDLQNSRQFEKTKMGMLNSVLTEFNHKYDGICNLKFKKEDIVQRLDYEKTVQKENIQKVNAVFKEKKIHIVDQIGDKYSVIFCENIRTLLKEKYDVESTIGKRVSKEKLNIILIHNAAYYDGSNDPYDKKYKEAAVQHITFEDFSDSSQFAVATVVHEIIIKKDLQEKRISLFDWKATGFKGPVSFGMEAEIDEEKRYFFMTVDPDGSFKIKEQEITLFELTEYTEMAEILESAKGVIRFETGDINIIKDTDMFTIPEIESIGTLLKEGDNKLRGKNRREELLSSCLDIKIFEKNNEKYYFVGTIGSGMRATIQRACVIRKLEGYKGASVMFDKILPLMDVLFVRNGQLTVVPFPFKYLREYIDTLKS